jgi:hypothetical protein
MPSKPGDVGDDRRIGAQRVERGGHGGLAAAANTWIMPSVSTTLKNRPNR